MSGDTNLDCSGKSILQNKKANVLIDWSEIYFEPTQKESGAAETFVPVDVSEDTNIDFSDVSPLNKDEINMLFDWSDIHYKFSGKKDGAPKTSVSKYLSGNTNFDCSDVPTRHEKETNAPVDLSGKHSPNFERRQMDPGYSNNRTESPTSPETSRLDEEFENWFFTEPTFGFFGVIENDSLVTKKTSENAESNEMCSNKALIEPKIQQSKIASDNGSFPGKTDTGPIFEQSEVAEENNLYSGMIPFESTSHAYDFVGDENVFSGNMEHVVEESEVFERDGIFYYDTEMARSYEPFGVRKGTEQSQEPKNAIDSILVQADTDKQHTGMVYGDDSFVCGGFYHNTEANRVGRSYELTNGVLPQENPWFERPDFSTGTSVEGFLMNDGIIGNTTHEHNMQTASIAPIYRRFKGYNTPINKKPDQFSLGSPIRDTNQVNKAKNEHLTKSVAKDANRLKRSYKPTDGPLETPWCKQSKFSASNLPEGSQMTSSAVVNTTPEPTIKTVPVSQIPITAQEINDKLNHPIQFNLDTVKFAENIKDWLYSHNVTQEQFANHILNLSRKAAWKLLNYPVAWTALRTGKRTFTKMYNFLNMNPEMQVAAFKLNLYQNKVNRFNDRVLPRETPWCKQSKFSAGTLPEDSQMSSFASVNTTPAPSIKTVTAAPIPITAQGINDKLNCPILFNIDIAKVTKNIKDWLNSNNITQELFANSILNLSEKEAWKYFNYHVAWSAMRTRKWIFTRMYNFLNMNPEMQAAAFRLNLYQNKLTYASLKQ